MSRVPGTVVHAIAEAECVASSAASEMNDDCPNDHAGLPGRVFLTRARNLLAHAEVRLPARIYSQDGPVASNASMIDGTCGQTQRANPARHVRRNNPGTFERAC